MSTESQWHSEDPSLSLPAQRSRWPFVLLFIVILALAGGGGAYAWMNLDHLMDFAQGKTSEARTATGDEAVMTDLLAAQQKTNEDIAALEHRIAEQQQQLREVTDQLADVTAKLGALKGAAAPPPSPVLLPPTPTPPPVLSAQPPPPPPQRAAPRPKQPPRPAPATGPISVGGAPLNAAAAPR